MAMPAPEFTPNDEPATKGDIDALHEELHTVVEIIRRVFTEPNMAAIERFMSNPAARWRNRNELRKQG